MRKEHSSHVVPIRLFLAITVTVEFTRLARVYRPRTGLKSTGQITAIQRKGEHISLPNPQSVPGREAQN